MEALLDNGYYISASVLRLEIAQKSILNNPLGVDQINFAELLLDDESSSLSELAEENLIHITNLLSSSNDSIADPEKRLNLLEKISCLACNACLMKKAKLRIKSKRKQLSSNNPTLSIPNEDEHLAIEKNLMVNDLSASDSISALSDPIIDLVHGNSKISASPKKITRKASILKSPSSSLSGPLLSNFFMVVPKENEQPIDIDASNLNYTQSEDISEFWSYFPQFFVKPNVKMALTSGMTAGKIRKKNFYLTNEDKEIQEVPSLPYIRFKLFHFAENIRPCYFGTFSKHSSIINGRRPFTKDLSTGLGLDYSINSDDEWEDCCDELEGEVENLSDTDQSDSSLDEDEDEDDSSWLVPHGYLSEDEIMGSDCDESDVTLPFSNEDLSDPVSRKRLQNSWRTTNQNLSLNIIPKIYSCLKTMADQDISFLSTFQMKKYMPLLSSFISLNPFNDGLVLDETNLAIRAVNRDESTYDEMILSKKKKKPLIHIDGLLEGRKVRKKAKNNELMTKTISNGAPINDSQICIGKENNILMDNLIQDPISTLKKRITPIVVSRPLVLSSLSVGGTIQTLNPTQNNNLP